MLLAASLQVLKRQREPFMAVIALTAACWTVGCALWATGCSVHRLVGGRLAFLVLTIAGERLELSRFMPPPRAAERLFGGVVLVLLAGLAAWAQPWGPHLFGAALLALAAWLLRNDIARRTVRQQGLTRFIAVCLLSGYFWLALGGAVIAGWGLAPGGPAYDAALHALLLGFVFAMVFGHAPIIFPAVLRVAVPYHPVFYAPLVLLHASLALRLAGAPAASRRCAGAPCCRRWRWSASSPTPSPRCCAGGGPPRRARAERRFPPRFPIRQATACQSAAKKWQALPATTNRCQTKCA